MTLNLAGPKLRALVVENDSTQRERLVELLEGWDYRVFQAVGMDDALLIDATQKARDHRCHLAIVDMRLKNDGHDNDTSGLELVPHLAPTVSIIRSGYGSVKNVDEALAPADPLRKDVPLRAYRFVEKAGGTDTLEKAINGAVTEIWRHRKVDFVSSSDFSCESLAQRLSELGDGEIYADEVEDMLRRLFPAAKRLKIEAVNEAQRRGLSVPRGHSIVVKVTQDEHFSSYVVKLTTTYKDKEWAADSDELKRFNHVRPFFTGQRYAGVVGSPVRLWNLMGIVYEFLAGDEDRPICSLADYYRDNQTDAINKVLGNVRRLWRRLYENRTQQREPVFRAYDAAWNRKLSQRLLEFRTFSSPYPDVLVKLNLPNPFAWLADKVALQDNGNYQDGGLPDTTFAICHGDLHSENVFADIQHDIWLIDYERTGEGPLLQDFTELESDILTSLVNLQATEVEQFTQLVCALIEPKALMPEQQLAVFPTDSEAGKAFAVICAWRELASSVLGVGGGDKRQYYYGLLFNALFRLTLLLREQGDEAFAGSEKLSQATRCLILAGLLCQRLENWNKSWPLREWETVLGCLTQQEPKEITHPQPKPIKVIASASTHPVKVLFLSANPSDTASLQLDEEVRAIDNALQRGSLRDYFQVAVHSAVRADDLQGLLERHKPDIVHFSGHGGSNGQIYLQGEDGKHHPVTPRALSNLFKLLKNNIRCVVLNACYSDIQSQAIVQHIDVVIGVSQAISDEAAIKFAAGFYESLAWGHNVQEAFDLGCARIDLANLEEQDKPKLLARPGRDPLTIFFARIPVMEPISPQEDGQSRNTSKHDPLPPREKTPISIFYSYSHRDEKLRDRLAAHLSLLKREGAISEWHDRKITAGREWEGQIDAHLDSAQIVLLLISADFLASDYCYDVEMTRALERHDAREAQVIPIILKPVDWEKSRFGKLLAFPKDGKPVTEWSNRDAAFKNIAQAIRKAVSEIS